jgi:hypothetical protein
MSSTFKLPPSERDFEIYEAVHISGCSTWSQADKHQISQTRVRQVICRVVEWLGEVLPPQAKIAKEQETHLARQIAADRFQRQYEQATTFWNETQESKYAGLRMRITTAQARLGVVGGILDGLAADAIEGIPVPVWQAPAAPVGRRSPDPAAPVERGSPDAPVGRGSPDPAHPHAATTPGIGEQPHRPSRRGRIQLPPELCDPLTFDELTPEIVAARAAYGRPLPPNLIRHAQEVGRMWPRAEADSADPTPASSPPVEDCSAADLHPAPCEAPAATLTAENPSTTAACDDDAPQRGGPSSDDCAASQPLLIGSTEPSVTQLQITPDQPGATISAAENMIPALSALSAAGRPLYC